MATGFITIKQGEQWITLNYENKNKKMTSNLALSLIDCVKLKLYCDVKNKSQINSTFNNISINTSALNLNTNSNYTNRNVNKTKQVINQINLKITKRNTNKALLKGSPIKTNYNQMSTKRSPNKSLYDLNNRIKNPYNEEGGINNNNNLIKNNNYNTFNYMNVNINMNPYTTISKCSIKKIDLNSSSKTRNSKIAKKKSANNNYTSLRTTNNNLGIKKMNTSTCSLNTVNKNKNKKSRLTPDIEIKEIKNVKGIGGSPGPNFSRKKKLDMEIYDNLDKSNQRSPLYNAKLKNFPLKEMKHKNEDNFNNKMKRKSNNYSNNIKDNNINLNSINNNHLNINLNMNRNISNNTHKVNNNKCRTINGTINDNNFNNTFNNTFNNINKQVIKNKLLYNSKPININNQQMNINNTINGNSSNKIKKSNDLEGSANSFDEEEKNKTKDNSKICDRVKIGIYTTKRIDIKKNNNQIINKKLNSQENSNKLSHKILLKSGELSTVDNENNNNKNEFSDNNNNIKIDEYDKIEIETDSNKKDKDILNNDKLNVVNDEDDIEEYDENDNYTRIKEDFILLYNDDYVNNIQDDLLKLEIELFIEKMTDLITCYHMQLEEKRMENELYQNEYNLSSAKFKEINKLIKKLEMIKIDYDIRNMKSTYNKKTIKKQDKIDLIVTKTEIEIFKNIFPDNNNNENKDKINILKSIMMNILKKEENRNILSNNQNFNIWIDLCNKKKEEINKGEEINANENEQNEQNNQQTQIDNCNYNETSLNNIDNNINKNGIKNNNLDIAYKRKMPISPIYPKNNNNKYIPGNEVVL